MRLVLMDIAKPCMILPNADLDPSRERRHYSKNLSKMMKELVGVASFHFFDTMDSDNLIVNFILRSRGLRTTCYDRDIIMDMDVNELGWSAKLCG
ncbi:hypothetical protein ACSQ67_008117 [Phaseolus vulgaris]